MAELSAPIMKKCFLWVANASFLRKYSAKINSVIAAKPTLNSINTAGPKLFAAMRINKKEAPQIAARMNKRNKLGNDMVLHS